MRVTFFLMVMVIGASISIPASAQENFEPATDTAPAMRIELMPSALYLASFGETPSLHYGPELSMGVTVPLDVSWSVVVRGRGALALDEQTPSGELNDAPPCGGSFWTFCEGDADFRAPLGLDVGVRLDQEVAGRRSFALLLGFEIAGSVTMYASTYERIGPSMGLGASGALRIGFRRNRFSLVVFAGGRLEGDPILRAGWAAAVGGLNFSFAI